MSPVPAQRTALALARVLTTFLSVALAIALAVAPALAAETSSARQTMGDILDSLTHAPEQQQTATGFPKTPARPTPGATQTGPTAPTAPKAPVVKALPSQPAGSPLSTSPQTAFPQTVAPLPGSAFPGAPAQSAPRQDSSRRARPQPQRSLGLDTLRLEHDGRERLALVRLPRGLALNKGASARALPVVIFLHGAGGSARQAMQQTGLAGLADRAGFLAVFPEGSAAPQGQENAGIQTWNSWMCCGYARDQKIDDVGFLAALISRLQADYPVDPRRIYLAGFSNGAMLASRFALERPGVVAAIASVAGQLPCEQALPKEPLPVLLIHGNHDRVARFGPVQGQPRTGRLCDDFPAKAQADFWVHGLGLDPRPQLVRDGRNSRTRLERYGSDKKTGRAVVEFVIVKGGGHAWPGGEAVRYRYCDLPTPDPDATAMLWDFFKRQARPGTPEKAATPSKAGKKAGRR